MDLSQTALFTGIAPQDIGPMLQCLQARKTEYKKGDCVLRQGQAAQYVGVVLDGALSIEKQDADGERSLLARLEPGDHFAEALCCAGVTESPVSVTAEADSQVMLLDFKRILEFCPNACVFHSKLIENMLHILAKKNIQMQTRMEYMSKKTIRKKILKYLASFSVPKGQAFTLPFNREELADYLCIDRSALSRELAALKRENKIDYWKNSFKWV